MPSCWSFRPVRLNLFQRPTIPHASAALSPSKPFCVSRSDFRILFTPSYRLENQMYSTSRFPLRFPTHTLEVEFSIQFFRTPRVCRASFASLFSRSRSKSIQYPGLITPRDCHAVSVSARSVLFSPADLRPGSQLSEPVR